MKKRVLLTSFLALAVSAVPAFAQDHVGSVELEGKVTGLQNNKSKFVEYRDLGSGASASFLFDWLNDKGYFFNFSAENLGYNSDDQSTLRDKEFRLNGGKVDEFKYSLFYKQIPHVLTLGARSDFNGIGSTALVSTQATGNNISDANLAHFFNKPTFDYRMDRQDYGAGFEVSFNSPFFFNARFERNETKGLLPMGASSGGVKELPAPVDYQVDNVYLNTGYRTNNLIFTLDGTISDFKNANSSFTYGFNNAAPAATARTYLAPNSMNYKVGGNMMYRLPFWSTTFVARASHSISENTISLNEETGVTQLSPTNRFDGKITYTTASAAITATPVKPLDVKLFINVLDKQNQSSDPFRYSTGAFNAATGTTEKFAYNKLNGGFDVGYKLPAKTKVSAGYEYLRVNRTMMEPDPTNTSSWGVRNDAPQTTDHILYAKAKNNLFDWLTANLKYQRLFRTSDFQGGAFASLTDNRLIKAFWRPSDTADKTQDTVKLGLDFEPLDALTLGMEYSFKYNKYTKSVLGMQNDTRHELYFDANYRVAMVKLNPYAELELVDNYSKHRRYQTAGAASPFSAVNDNTNYNWTSARKDVSYALGVNADIDIIKDKLSATTSYRYDNSNGTQDFTATFATTTPLVNNENVDNYTKNTFSAKLKYNVTKNLNVGVGYLFENLRYTDDHYTGYNYLTTATASSGAHLTGAYANPNYDAHVGYMTVGYKF